MVVLGIILLLLGLFVAAYVLLAGLPPEGATLVSLELFGLRVETSAVVVFALGAITLLLIQLGLLALRAGTRKSVKRRSELQRLRRVEAEVESRQATQSQRNAEAPVAEKAPAPFTRRDPSPAPEAVPEHRSTQADQASARPTDAPSRTDSPEPDTRTDIPVPPATTADRNDATGGSTRTNPDPGSTR